MIRGKKVEIDKPTPVNIDIKASIHNRFDIEVIDSITGKIKQTAVAYNIILDAMWTNFLVNAWNLYIHVGTGSGTPSPSRTSLFNFLGSKSSALDTHSGYGSPIWSRRKITILETEYVGSELTEVGIAKGSASNTLMTHALFQDSNGNNISIIKTNTDIINIYSTVYFYYNTNGYDGIYFCYDGGTKHHDIILQTLFGYTSNVRKIFGFAYLTKYQTRNNITSESVYPLGLSSNPSDNAGPSEYSSYSFDSQTKTLNVSFNRFGADKGNNYGGSPSIIISGGWIASSSSRFFRPTIFIPAKSIGPWSITNESVGVGDGSTVDFELKFGNASNYKIYINGSELPTSEYTVKKTPPALGNTSRGLEKDISCFVYEYIDKLEVPMVTGYGVFTRLGYQTTSTNTIYTWYTRNYLTFYNEYYDLGIDYFVFFVGTASASAANTYLTKWWLSVQCSNDGQNWIDLPQPTSSTGSYLSIPGAGCWTYNIDSQYKNYKYFRLKRLVDTSDTNSGYVYGIVSNNYTGKALHFNTPPAVGDVITASYDTDFLPKDENHVFDLSLTMQFGEYTD